MNDKIKEKIQSLCPDVMELKFGCEILVKYGEEKRRAIVIEQKSKGTEGNAYGSWVLKFVDTTDPLFTFNSVRTITRREMTEVIQQGEILGSPITLAVVLRAIEKQSGYLSKSDTWDIISRWNLLKDYDDQTEETRRFIGSLLGV